VTLEREVFVAGPALAAPPTLPSLEFPLDLGRQGRADPEYAPRYLPEVYPARSFQEMAGEDYLNSLSLIQGRADGVNPFRVAQQEVQQLQASGDLRLRKLIKVAALAALYQRQGFSPDAAVSTLLGRSEYGTNELMIDLAVPQLLRFLPRQLTGVTGGEGLVPTDLAVRTPTSFDSVAALDPLLRRAAQRGLRAVVIADRGRIDGAEQAAARAAELRASGALPPDFTVITGENIESTAGAVLGVFLTERVPEQLTMAETVRVIHAQGGLAYLAHPGLPGGPRMLRDLPFDGYLLRSGFFEMFRTMEILYDSRLSNKLALYASGSPYVEGVGLPCSVIEAADTRPETLRAALRDRQAYAASGLYLPYMAAITLKPIGGLLRLLNLFFVAHDSAELTLSRMLRADNVQIFTSWDEEAKKWMGLWGLPQGVGDLLRGTSPFTEEPEVQAISLEYGAYRVQYQLPARVISLQSTLTW
jgi:hypothetical protein